MYVYISDFWLQRIFNLHQICNHKFPAYGTTVMHYYTAKNSQIVKQQSYKTSNQYFFLWKLIIAVVCWYLFWASGSCLHTRTYFCIFLLKVAWRRGIISWNSTIVRNSAFRESFCVNITVTGALNFEYQKWWAWKR